MGKLKLNGAAAHLVWLFSISALHCGGGGTEGDGETEEDLLSETDQSDGIETPDAVTDGNEDGLEVLEEDAAADVEGEEAGDAVEVDPFLRGVAISSFQAENGPGVVDTNVDWYAWATDPIEDMVSGDDPAEAPGLWNRDTLDGALDFLDGTCVNAYRFTFEWSRLFPMATYDITVDFEEQDGFITSVSVDAAVLEEMDGRVSPAALAYYQDLLDNLAARGLEPVATINHFTLPLWLHNPREVHEKLRYYVVDPDLEADIDRGGWLQRRTVVEFAKFSAYLAWKFGDRVRYWFTINEPMIVALGFIRVLPSDIGSFPNESFPPGVFLTFENYNVLLRHLASAHMTAYDGVKAFAPDAEVGIVKNTITFTPVDGTSSADIQSVAHIDYYYNDFLLNILLNGWYDRDFNRTMDAGETYDFGGKMDVLGVNYYFRQWVKYSIAARGLFWSKGFPADIFDFEPQMEQCEDCTDFNWDIYPDGLRERLIDYHLTWALPMMITENGLADAADAKRERFIRDHLAVVEELGESIPILGYMHWSLIDNFEWAYGFQEKFGLLSYEFDDSWNITITPRASFSYYGCLE